MLDVAKSHRTAARSGRNARTGRSALIRSAFAAALAAGVEGARADVPQLETGTLSCSVSATQAFVIGSNTALDCIFSATGRPGVRYVGEIGRVGIDLGFSTGANLVWAVVVSATDRVPDTLAGSYVGASVGITPGIGAGANVLIGGSDRAISLRPVSVEAKMGLNLAAGLATLTLRRP